jgi:type IV secretory pathway VirB4 component
MVIFAKSGAGKSVTMKTLISRSCVLMGIETLALDAEGEYRAVAEALGGEEEAKGGCFGAQSE